MNSGSVANWRRRDADMTARDPPGASNGSGSDPAPHTNQATGEEETEETTAPLDGDGVADPLAITSVLEAITAQNRAIPVVAPLWTEYRLAACHLDLLKQRIDLFGEGGKLRCGYFSRTKTFVHEVPSSAHQMCANKFRWSVYEKVLRLCPSLAELPFVKEVIFDHSPTIEASDGQGNDFHQADLFVNHILSMDYGFCLEFAYAQKRDRLSDLAQFYIHDSETETRLVIGIDYDPKHSKKATLRTWRRDGDKLQAHVQDLRADDGKPIPGDPLRINVLDIAPPHCTPLSMHSKAIEFSVKELDDILYVQDYHHWKLWQYGGVPEPRYD
ncbi:uncharacterized protein A1O5_07250 [Cladophialophora psammophila CBS 110553]|uniref:Uncharacterized protein n=1 Tax=Cladophialophora psammophila CBS 110553 TaxID=1182543 RepID=W9XFQ5_9EURO|nr:uncharacterized protein A1O5_07250 [Cladophialophora psammophila CBS 110553]EXJ69214.1 hypothetical protein A1O5_07250 [Cladophialophora psammophila CBS 110553]